MPPEKDASKYWSEQTAKIEPDQAAWEQDIAALYRKMRDINGIETQSFEKRIAVLQQERNSAIVEAALAKQTMRQFVKFAMALLKRCGHIPDCPAERNLTADCTCGLSDVAEAVGKEAGAIVFETMQQQAYAQGPQECTEAVA